jgi:hypothetical protein
MSASASQEENFIFAQVSLSDALRTPPRSSRRRRDVSESPRRREAHWERLLWRSQSTNNNGDDDQNKVLAECDDNDHDNAAFEIPLPSSPDIERNDHILRRRKTRRRRRYISPTVSLPILVFVDMFAVALVVPLLFQYYKSAGIVRADQREWLGSLFSCAQILGGLSMAFLTDSKMLSRKTIMLFSFGGSAVSYALIVFGGLPAIVLSRLIVGLVKQTMTVARTMLTKSTAAHDRSLHMGRLTAASTGAWITGPSVGALLYKYIDVRAPPLVACALFCVNLLLAMALLPPDHYENNHIEDGPTDDNKTGLSKEKSDDSKITSYMVSKGALRIFSNLRQCFTSKQLGSAVLATLLVTWVTKATNYSQLGSFYEEMYGLEPHHRGYISSYQQALQFIVNVWLVTPIMHITGGERKATCVCSAILAVAVFLEGQRSLSLFLIILCPILSLSFAIINLSLQTLVTHVTPAHSVFSVLAALDVLQNIVSVSVPFYRTLLFQWLLPVNASHASIMQGDPDPVAWVRASALHWLLAALAMAGLLLPIHTNQYAGSSNDAKEKLMNKPKGK